MNKYILLLFVLLPLFGFSQQPAKKVLAMENYASWNTLKNPIISNDGKVIAYEINPQKGDGKLVVHNHKQEFILPRGYKAQIGSDNDFIIYHIKQPLSTIRKAKKDKVKKDKMPGDSLGIYVFEHDSAVLFPNVKSYKLPKENASWIAFTAKKEKKKVSKEEGEESEVKEKKEAKKDKKDEPEGDDLVLFNVANADTFLFHYVTEYFYAKKGNGIVFVSQAKDSISTYSTVHFFSTETNKSKKLFSSEGWVKKITADELAGQVAFLHSADTIEKKVYKMYYTLTETGNPEVVVEANMPGVPLGWSPSENGNVSFSENGSKLFVGMASTPKPEPEDSLLEEEKPKLDIWNWKDLKIQPQQKVEASKEKERTYKGVFHIEKGKFVQLEDLNVNNLRFIQKQNGDVALGRDTKPYQRETSWTGKGSADYYLVDIPSGIKRQVLREKERVWLSPTGKYIVWYEPADSSYYCQSTVLGELKEVALTKAIPVNFYEETNDMPIDPRPYGIAGWSENDKFVFIYDRYDIWKIDPAGYRVPVNATHAFGRRNKTRLKYVKLDKEEQFIPSDERIFLSAFDERTMASGYFSAILDNAKDPKLEMMDHYMFDNIAKAKDADKIIWTKQNVEVFPDLWSSNLHFQHAEKLSSANPQQSKFNWAKVEVVEWTSFTGENLRGLLYTPENLNPKKKYPMVVYFYERSVHTKNRHYFPYPSRSTINKTFYASNGYCVFVPDITYKDGYPGQSAYNAIVSGVNNLIITRPFIDKENIGLQGQSWGGYQTAFLVTETDMFKAAMAGAPVSNMTSAYGGIRWASGMSRMFQYEHTQSRLGGTLWERPFIYIENSPLFNAPKINTPLLMMHNDNDGAVPWYQGIELFVALRRLDKPAWLLTYNGEPHNLKAESWANRVDLSKRMFQFFNHYLKGEEAPEWMEKGIQAVDKGKKLGY